MYDKKNKIKFRKSETHFLKLFLTVSNFVGVCGFISGSRK